MSASLFDWGLCFFHNARNLVARGSGPYFYLPKLESHLEARLWNDVFIRGQEALGLPRGTIRATVLIETIMAAFESEEILYELREHAAGLNCGRWDYMFSMVKKFRNHREYLFPDRTLITMTVPFMRAYCFHVIQVCHRHGAYAMGGMAAQIPIRNDPAANAEALAKVRADKEREVDDGHDGTWVAHPGLVATAIEAFKHMPGTQSDQSAPRGRESRRGRPPDATARAHHREGRPLEHPCRHPLSRSVARRLGLRTDPKPDGGPGDLGDFPGPALAVAAFRGGAGRWAQDHGRTLPRLPGRRAGRDSRGIRSRTVRRRRISPRPSISS